MLIRVSYIVYFFQHAEIYFDAILHLFMKNDVLGHLPSQKFLLNMLNKHYFAVIFVPCRNATEGLGYGLRVCIPLAVCHISVDATPWKPRNRFC